MTVFIIADDLTGANDSLVRFANVGVKSVTVFDAGRCGKDLPYSALALSLATRGLSPEAAYRVTREAAESLPLATGDILYKKMDSALRGNPGAEIAAILDGLSDGKTALVAPALPQNRRITRDGYQLADGIPIHRTEMAFDPVTPVRESHLPTLLADGGRYRVGHLPLNTVVHGVKAITSDVERLLAEGCRMIVADAVDVKDLDALAKVCADHVFTILPCGTAGFAGALARQLFPAAAKDQSGSEVTTRPGGIVAALIGSKSRNASRQMEHALTELDGLAEIVVSRTALNFPESREAAIEQVSRQTEQALSLGKHSFIVRFDRDKDVDGASLDAMALATGLGKIGRGLIESFPVKALYLSGGDIAIGAMNELGGWGMEVRREPEPGVCVGRIWGGAFEGLNIITKAGSFGDDGTLTRIFRECCRNAG